MTLQRLEVERIIPVEPAEVFRLLCDPQGHVAIDSSGMLQSAEGAPVTASGDRFVVHMDREALNDYPELGRYDVTVTIDRFDPDREISWTIIGQIEPQLGHSYGYRLAPSDRGTLVTSYYDWSEAHPVWKDSGVFPVISEGALRATLGVLARRLINDDWSPTPTHTRRVPAERDEMAEGWSAVDAYLTETLIPPDPALDAALEASDAARLPPIAVSTTQGRLLNLLVRAVGAARVLEIGTLGGYSTIWMARALPPDGVVVSLEIDSDHAEVARANIDLAGLGGSVDVRVGAGLDMLAAMHGGEQPFDLVFIDADKEQTAEYLHQSVALSRPGTLIVVDNTVRGGAVADPATSDTGAQGIRRMHEAIADHPRLMATAIQTVGSKGWDGLTFVLVTD